MATGGKSDDADALRINAPVARVATQHADGFEGILLAVGQAFFKAVRFGQSILQDGHCEALCSKIASDGMSLAVDDLHRVTTAGTHDHCGIAMRGLRRSIDGESGCLDVIDGSVEAEVVVVADAESDLLGFGCRRAFNGLRRRRTQRKLGMISRRDGLSVQQAR